MDEDKPDAALPTPTVPAPPRDQSPALPQSWPQSWPRPYQRWLASDEMTDAHWSLVEDYATRFGRQYDSFLTVRAPGRRTFFAEGGKGIVSGVQRGRRFGVFGGILGAPEDWDQIVMELLRDCRTQNLNAGFFAVDQATRDTLARHGFQANKFGESAIVDLAQTDWKGKRYEWVRRQTSYCQRQGLTVEECAKHSTSADGWQALTAELLEIEKQFLTDRSHGGHLRHVVGQFGGTLNARQRLFLARQPKTGVIEAFLICNPSLDGRRFVLECFRRRLDATRGVIPYLLHQAMQHLKAEGVAEADLCMVPFINCEAPLAGDHWLSRKAIGFTGRHLNWIYDAQGLFHFKSRFRPEFRDLYVCATPRIDLGSMHYIIAECGFLKISPGNVGRKIREHIAKRRARSNLAPTHET